MLDFIRTIFTSMARGFGWKLGEDAANALVGEGRDLLEHR